MNNRLIYLWICVTLLIIFTVKWHDAELKINELTKENIVCLENNDQLVFNLQMLHKLKCKNINESSSFITTGDSIMFFIVPRNVCFDCVNFELANNIRNKPIKIKVVTENDWDFRILSRSYSKYNFNRDSSEIFNGIDSPFYLFMINNEVIEFFKPNKNQNLFTIKFLTKYGFGE